MSGDSFQVLEKISPKNIDKLELDEELLGFTKELGIFGYDDLEVLILIGLITQDPLILIGDMGSGKTQILNNISKFLGFNHKHYNASMISFDDIVGFPYPFKEKEDNKMKIEYIMTPATVWEAQSVLIDEINRCKPETQNKLFSLIYEKKIQGIELKNLVYRWAAMNPYREEGDDKDIYSGVEPLDRALSDRFSLFIEVPKWNDIDKNTKYEILENLAESDIKTSKQFTETLEGKRDNYLNIIANPPFNLKKYVIDASELLNKSGILDISVRRARIISKNICALLSINPKPNEKEVFKVLKASIPDICWNSGINWDLVKLIHDKVFNFYKIELFKDSHIEKFENAKNFIDKAKVLISISSKEKSSLIVNWVINKSIDGDQRSFVFLYLILPLAFKNIIPLNSDALSAVSGYIKKTLSENSNKKNPNLICSQEAIEIISQNKFLKNFFMTFINKKGDSGEIILILKEMKDFIEYFCKEEI